MRVAPVEASVARQSVHVTPDVLEQRRQGVGRRNPWRRISTKAPQAFDGQQADVEGAVRLATHLLSAAEQKARLRGKLDRLASIQTADVAGFTIIGQQRFETLDLGTNGCECRVRSCLVVCDHRDFQ